MAIVGSGAIRKLGWRGGVTIFSEEREQPYDQTLLTKDYCDVGEIADKDNVSPATWMDINAKPANSPSNPRAT
jgi:hypothetical protein